VEQRAATWNRTNRVWSGGNQIKPSPNESIGACGCSLDGWIHGWLEWRLIECGIAGGGEGTVSEREEMVRGGVGIGSYSSRSQSPPPVAYAPPPPLLYFGRIGVDGRRG